MQKCFVEKANVKLTPGQGNAQPLLEKLHGADSDLALTKLSLHTTSPIADTIYIFMLWVPVTLGKVCTEAFEERCLQNLCASTAIQMLIVCGGRARGHRSDCISVCGTCG